MSSEETESEEDVQCTYCNNYMPSESIQGHIDRKHPAHTRTKCDYCPHFMPLSSLRAHIERKHSSQCRFCSNLFRIDMLNSHIAQVHKHQEMAGLVHGSRFTDEDFNNLVRENKIFSKNGVIYAITYK